MCLEEQSIGESQCSEWEAQAGHGLLSTYSWTQQRLSGYSPGAATVESRSWHRLPACLSSCGRNFAHQVLSPQLWPRPSRQLLDTARSCKYMNLAEVYVCPSSLGLHAEHPWQRDRPSADHCESAWEAPPPRHPRHRPGHQPSGQWAGPGAKRHTARHRHR